MTQFPLGLALIVSGYKNDATKIGSSSGKQLKPSFSHCKHGVAGWVRFETIGCLALSGRMQSGRPGAVKRSR
jgi:hypothetical protein